MPLVIDLILNGRLADGPITMKLACQTLGKDVSVQDFRAALEGDEHTGAWYRSAIGIDLIRERAVDR